MAQPHPYLIAYRSVQKEQPMFTIFVSGMIAIALLAALAVPPEDAL
jgi:hypothetical protein